MSDKTKWALAAATVAVLLLVGVLLTRTPGDPTELPIRQADGPGGFTDASSPVIRPDVVSMDGQTVEAAGYADRSRAGAVRVAPLDVVPVRLRLALQDGVPHTRKTADQRVSIRIRKVPAEGPIPDHESDGYFRSPLNVGHGSGDVSFPADGSPAEAVVMLETPAEPGVYALGIYHIPLVIGDGQMRSAFQSFITVDESAPRAGDEAHQRKYATTVRLRRGQVERMRAFQPASAGG